MSIRKALDAGNYGNQDLGVPAPPKRPSILEAEERLEKMVSTVEAIVLELCRRLDVVCQPTMEQEGDGCQPPAPTCKLAALIERHERTLGGVVATISDLLSRLEV